MSKNTTALPLAGYHVIDFGHYLAGPAVAMMLADLGAEIISITPPDGPRWPDPASTILSRNKKTLGIDLKTAQGLAQAKALIERADILIENFRPGVMQRLGLGAEKLCADHPDLIYLSLPGFAAHDHERKNLRAFEGIISAACGQFTDMGLNRVLMGINPSYSPLPLASAYGAVLGANAVLLALYHRQRSGQGDHIEVPLASALMEGLAYNSQRVENYPERYKSPREKEIHRRQSAGLPMDMSYHDLQEFLDPFYRSYPCRDGRLFYVVSASHTDHAKRTLKALGVWEEIKAAGIPEIDDWYRPMSEWPADCALGMYPLSPQWAELVSKAMATAFLSKTAYQWEELFGEQRVPGRAHRTTREWLHNNHAIKSGLLVQRNDPVLGDLISTGPVSWLTDSADAATRQKPQQQCSIDEAMALFSKPKTPCPKELSQTDHSWLSGIKILDMTNVIAGPTIASFLSRFGAQIIKLDPVKSTFDPWNTIVFGMQAGRGKQSLLANIKTPEGKEIFHQLLKWADIITINAVDRQVDELGLNEKSLKQINPQAILCQVDAFGGPKRGPMSDHLGYDDTVQAATGVMIRFGGGRDTPEEHAHFGTIDVLGGFAAAMATAAALVRREETGQPARARSSLMAAGQLIQLPFMYDHPGRAPFDEASGRHILGSNAHYRFYKASDGWFFLACAHADELKRLTALPAFSKLDDAENKEVFLENCFASLSIKKSIEILTKLDIGVVQPASIASLRDKYIKHGKPVVEKHGNTYQFTRHNIAGADRWVELFSPCAIRPTHGEITAYPPAEKYGASTGNILAMLGYDKQAVAQLRAKAIVSDSWSGDYLPD